MLWKFPDEISFDSLKDKFISWYKKDEVKQKLHIVKRKKKSKNTHNARNSICIYKGCVSFYKGTLCKRLKEFYRVFCVYLREILFFNLSSANRTLSKFFFSSAQNTHAENYSSVPKQFCYGVILRKDCSYCRLIITW